MSDSRFKGDTKVPLKSPLAQWEKAFISFLTPHMPRWIEGYHLTLMTIPISFVCVIAGFLARGNLAWLWLSSGALLMQWFTDCFDGALGRYRDTGIPKWGYHMDHLLDWIFMCSVLTGYAVLFQGASRILWLILIPVYGTFFVNSILAFAATQEFKITFLGIGPTELRLLLIIVNIVIIATGKEYIARALPIACIILAFTLVVAVYRSQKYIWNIDMKDKSARRENQGGTTTIV